MVNIQKSANSFLSDSPRYRAAQIIKMLRLDVSPPALLKAESVDRIPKATRLNNGSVSTRYWPIDSIPAIGRTFGKIKATQQTVVLACYVCKGGVGKSLFSFNFARIAALHGLRVLAMGTDFQCSLSKSFGASYDGERPLSLYDVIKGKTALQDIITQSDIPNLHYIPESTELTLLERHMVMMNRREDVISKLLKPLKPNYDLVVIDCGPSWLEITTSVLHAADVIVSPINADGESYHSFRIYMDELKSFMESNEKAFELVKFVPNNVNLSNRFTTGFQRKFLDEYRDVFTTSYLREAVVFKEATAVGKSIIEHAPTTGAADDMFGAIHEIWGEVVAARGEGVAE